MFGRTHWAVCPLRSPVMSGLSRRDAVKTFGLGVLGIASLAGCSGSSPSSGSSGGSSDGESPTPTATPESTESDEQPASGGTGTASSSSGGTPKAVEEWLADVGNYDGVVDKTRSSSVTVSVGASGNGGNFAFAPAAVRVSTGTTVTWEWTGKGSMHNVAADGGGFESKMTDEKGFTFTHEFTSAGVYNYFCTPHKAMGMKGSIVVE